MASSTDFKLLFEKYQKDGVKQGISIVEYCQMNGIVYSHFERWYKKYRAGVVLPGKPPIQRMAFCSSMNTFVSEQKQLSDGNQRIF